MRPNYRMLLLAATTLIGFSTALPTLTSRTPPSQNDAQPNSGPRWPYNGGIIDSGALQSAQGFEISSRWIAVGQFLGHGGFANVYAGVEYKVNENNGKRTLEAYQPVAIKTFFRPGGKGMKMMLDIWKYMSQQEAAVNYLGFTPNSYLDDFNLTGPQPKTSAAEARPQNEAQAQRQEPRITSRLVMELLSNATLGDMIRSGYLLNRTSESHAKQVFKVILQQVKIMELMHAEKRGLDGGITKRKMFHRDAKVDNWLWKLAEVENPNGKPISEYQLRLGDFDMATYNENSYGFGTKAYLPPEAFVQNFKFKSEKSDVWAIGVNLFYMIMGFRPWKEADDPLCQGVYNAGNPGSELAQIYPQMTEHATKILGLIFIPEDRRATMAEVLTAIQSLNQTKEFLKPGYIEQLRKRVGRRPGFGPDFP